MRLRKVLAVTLILLTASLAGAAMFSGMTKQALARPAAVMRDSSCFNPDADTFIYSDQPDTNYGTAFALVLERSGAVAI